MNIDRPRRLLLVPLALLIVLVIIVLHFGTNKKSPFYTRQVVDQCSGQTYSVTPNQGPEKFQNSSPDVLLGGSPILDAGATQAQYQQIQTLLAGYLKTNLGGKYSSLSLVPNSLKALSGSGTITAKLCLGMSNNRVNLAIKLTELKYVQVKVTDPSGRNGGNYDSGTVSAY